MKINAVFRTNKAVKPVGEGRGVTPYIPPVCIGLGLIIGTVFFLVCGTEIESELWELFIDFSLNYSNKTSMEILSGMIISNIPFFAAIYLLGTSSRGYIGISLLCFVKSFGFGLLTSYLYYSYELRGIEYCLLVLFPGKIIFFFALLLLSESSFSLSLSLSKAIKQKDGPHPDLSKYDLRTVVLYLIVLVSALIDLMMIKCFSSLFVFV